MLLPVPVKRIVWALAIVACVLLGFSGRAQAITELCPAAVSALHPLDAVASAKAANTFGFDLDALSAETVHGTIAVETDKGWFEVPFGPTRILALNETFSNGSGSFSRPNYASAALFARFPEAVSVKRAFIDRVTTDDVVFPWPSKGEMTCDYMTDGMKHDGKDAWPKRSELFALPSGAPQLVANPTTAFAHLPCAEPFVAAKIVNAVPPDYPFAAREDGTGGVVLEALVLDEHGSIVNQWMVSPPSWYFDASSDRAAHRSSYAAAISFCRAVPSVTFFLTEYRPDP